MQSWICLYPVYFDSTKSVQQGRRVIKDIASPHPLAKDIAEVVKNIGINCLYEVRRLFSSNLKIIKCYKYLKINSHTKNILVTGKILVEYAYNYLMKIRHLLGRKFQLVSLKSNLPSF